MANFAPTKYLIVDELACRGRTDNYSMAWEYAGNLAAEYPGRTFIVCQCLTYREASPEPSPSPDAPKGGAMSLPVEQEMRLAA